MPNRAHIAVRCSKHDKEALKEVATHFERSQSKTVLLLIREAHSFLKEQAAKQNGPNQTDNKPAA